MSVKSLKCSVEKTAVSGKTTYLVAGFEMEDGRPIQEGSKYKKAVEKGVQIINEDQLLKMIRDSDPEASAMAEAEEKKRREKERKEREAQRKKQLEQSQIPAGMKTERFGWIHCVIHSLLTTKYAPKQLSDIIGNARTIESLKQWLERWEAVHIKSSPDFRHSP